MRSWPRASAPPCWPMASTLREGPAGRPAGAARADSPAARPAWSPCWPTARGSPARHLLLAVGRAPRLAGLDLVAGDDRGRAARRRDRAGPALGLQPAGLGGGRHRRPARASGRAPSPMSRASMPASWCGRCCSACPAPGWTTPPCPASPIPTRRLAQVGLTEAEARDAGHADLRIHRWPLSENDRAIAEGRPEGLVKLVVTAKGTPARRRHPGAAGGRDGGDVRADDRPQLPLSALAALVLPYPTLAEGGKRAAGEFYTPKLLSPFTKRLIGLLKRLP